MSSEGKFGLLRKLLRAIGLSQGAADQVVDFIVDLLAGEDKSGDNKQAVEYPYHLRDHFLSPAELNFYMVLRGVINGRAVLCMKVGLADIFYVRKGNDASHWRIYTNKIDRKHVDFLLCDLKTMQPLAGIELDDSSHQRPDREARDEFVDGVFAAAHLPLIHIPVRRAYVPAEIEAQLAPYIGAQPDPVRPSPIKPLAGPQPTAPVKKAEPPRCPKCGSGMILRTVKNGTNAGNQFWGCSTYPTCRGIVPYKGASN
ncbi:MAG: DUF2726 domain-containing protein [Anaerolineae bacterium]|nr:DUF2726 domain-containing protein [Anaerolineae bacterium]